VESTAISGVNGSNFVLGRCNASFIQTSTSIEKRIRSLLANIANSQQQIAGIPIDSVVAIASNTVVDNFPLSSHHQIHA
jgi:hypothetical protein